MTPTEFKQRRLELGLTQAETAKILGMTTSMVQKYEYGYPVPFRVCFTLMNITKKEIKLILTST